VEHVPVSLCTLINRMTGKVKSRAMSDSDDPSGGGL